MVQPLPQPTIDRLRRLCDVHPQHVAADIVGVDRNTVTNAKARGWARGTGHPPKRPMPPDFPIQANYMTIAQLARHYRTGLACIYRWTSQVTRRYTPRSSGHEPLPIPDDLAEVIARVGPTQAALHYGVHANTLQAWREKRGLPVAHKRKKPSTRKGSNHV